MLSLTLIVAATLNNGIGRLGKLPWKLSTDMAYFAHVTTHAPEGKTNAVIMGRKTWETIPAAYRPLKKRENIILSHNPDYLKDSASDAGSASVYTTSQDALSYAANAQSAGRIYRAFIIGGSAIYEHALEATGSSCGAQTDRILITRVLSPAFADCDAFFPEFRELKDEEGRPLWKQATHEDLEAWAGRPVPRGVQEENGVEFEFQMWIRQ